LSPPFRYIGSSITLLVIEALALPSLFGHRSVIRRYRKSGTASTASFFLVWESEIFILLESSVTSRLGRKQPSVSFPLLVADRRSGYVFVLVWLSLGTLVYFLFFANYCIHGRLFSDCLWYIHDGVLGSRGMGRLYASC
jgi:hypothetical protein